MDRRLLALSFVVLLSAAVPTSASGPRAAGGKAGGIQILDAAYDAEAGAAQVQMRWNRAALTGRGPDAGRIAIASCTGEPCAVTLDFYRIADKGLEEKYYAFELEKAVVVESEEWLPETFVSATHKHGSRGGLYRSAWYDYKSLRPAVAGASDVAPADLCGSVKIGRGVDLSGCFNAAADLASMDLSGAVMTRTFLQYADLSGARLSGADLGGARLEHASMAGADLTDANLSGATMAGADLTNVTFCRTVMPDGAVNSAGCP